MKAEKFLTKFSPQSAWVKMAQKNYRFQRKQFEWQSEDFCKRNVSNNKSSYNVIGLRWFNLSFLNSVSRVKKHFLFIKILW